MVRFLVLFLALTLRAHALSFRNKSSDLESLPKVGDIFESDIDNYEQMRNILHTDDACAMQTASDTILEMVEEIKMYD